MNGYIIDETNLHLKKVSIRLREVNKSSNALVFGHTSDQKYSEVKMPDCMKKLKTLGAPKKYDLENTSIKTFISSTNLEVIFIIKII